MLWIKNSAVLFLAVTMFLAEHAARIPPAALQTLPITLVPPVSTPQVVPQFLVLIDAAHGGRDIGARLTPALLEKDLTLDLSNRFRSMLAAQGIDVRITRDADTALSAVSRAETANSKPSSACIIFHATATGSGVHLYTSSLAPAPLSKFMPWRTAQAAYVTQSLKLSSDVDSALAHAEIPVTLGRTSLQPMDSFACPAVAVEFAPLLGGSSTKASPISDATYQRAILAALSAAIDQWRKDWRQQQ